MHDVTRRQHAHALEIGIVAYHQGGRCGLVEVTHPLLHPSGRHEGGSVECEAEHLQVVDPVPATDSAPREPSPTGRRGVSAGVRDVALVEGEPAVVGPRLEWIQESPGAL